MTYYKVSVAGVHAGRKYYTYQSPESLQKGMLVQVPFGKKIVYGIVRDIVKKPTFNTKNINHTFAITLPATSLALLNWIEQFYPYDFGDIASLFIPPNLATKSRTAPLIANISNTIKQPALTVDQQSALSIIKNNQKVLLHGETGTGKTRVFLEYAQTVLSSGKSVLILTPEIGLTPQLQQSVSSFCQVPIHVIHSQLTPAQRKNIWLHAIQGDTPSVFIGPRSALFLPYTSLGLVVVDEAHDNSYKNFQSPRYNGLYIAAQVAHIHKAHFIQSTATPNVADYYALQQKNVPIARMKTIAAGEPIVNGVVIDATDSTQFTQHTLLSDQLISAVYGAMQHGLQSLLFLNRRGSARIIQCKACGYMYDCKTCGLPMTYHHDIHVLKCHICNTTTAAPSSCIECKSTDLLYATAGTKAIERDIQNLFPNASVARFDLDNSAKDAMHRNLQQLQQGNYDIIVGTQIITKGLDLPKLSVVGVINADTSFALPDYRAEEIAFQQLYQVTGRVGRGHVLSKYFIQTRQKDHPVIQAALKRDWQTFYDYERAKRHHYSYPPYAYIATATITRSRQASAEKVALALAAQLTNNTQVQVIGPSPSYYETAHGGFTWHILIKAKNRSTLAEVLRAIPAEWTTDIDPISVL